MSSEFKSIKSLELCMKLPTKDCPLESPVFFLKSCECLFRFALEKDGGWYYTMYVKVKSGHSIWKPCKIKIQVGFKKEQNFSFDEKYYTVSEYGKIEIWCYEMNTLRSNLPSDYTDGNWIKFRFSFEDVDVDDLEIRKEMISGQKLPAPTSQYLQENYSLEKLSEDFAKLILESDAKKDVKLRCGNVVLKADKTILRARSPWFAEKLHSRTEDVIEVPFMDQATLNEIIRYIYMGKTPDLSFENAKKLYAAGSLCKIDCLTQKCVEFLMDSLTVDNACEVLAIAADEDFSDKIVSYIMKTDIPYIDEYWKPFCHQHPKCAILILNKIVREKRRS